MAKNSKEGSHIRLPWDESNSSTNRILCPKCGNDGMDGSITGFSTQWGLTRKCLKVGEDKKVCGFKWSGGIGVQIADFSEPLPLPGIERKEDPPLVQYTGGQYRDPNKNFDSED